MKMSTRGRYGARAMLDIALNCDKGPVPLKDMSQRQQISIKYLEQLIQPLKTAGLIKSVRGAGGGYTLARLPQEISLLQIVTALERLSPTDCVEAPEACPRAGKCVAHDVWQEVQNSINDVLASFTLMDMAERQLEKDAEH